MRFGLTRIFKPAMHRIVDRSTPHLTPNVQVPQLQRSILLVQYVMKTPQATLRDVSHSAQHTQ